MKKRAKKAIVWVMLCVMLCTVLLPVKAYAAETAKSEEHVRGAQAQQERTAPVYTAELVRTFRFSEPAAWGVTTLTVTVKIHVTYYLEEGVTSGILDTYYTVLSADVDGSAATVVRIKEPYNQGAYRCSKFMVNNTGVIYIGVACDEWGDFTFVSGRIIEDDEDTENV